MITQRFIGHCNAVGVTTRCLSVFKHAPPLCVVIYSVDSWEQVGLKVALSPLLRVRSWLHPF